MKLTPVQTRMVEVLSDGLPHTRKELEACLFDELSGRNAMNMQLSRLRKKLRPNGEDILCEWCAKQYMYRRVRLLAPAAAVYR